MEKFSQFRDKGEQNIPSLESLTYLPGTAIAPFLPIPTEPAGIYLPFHIFLFLVRVPLLLTLTLGYFFIFQWLPIGNLGKRAALWSMMGVPGIWWIDLQIDGVRRGYEAHFNELEHSTKPAQVCISEQRPAPTRWLSYGIDLCISDRCSLLGCHFRPSLHRLLPIDSPGRAHLPLRGYASILFVTQAGT